MVSVADRCSAESPEKRARRTSDHEEPEGLDRALGEHAVDEPLRIEVAPSERQVFVKTVPPSTSRKELEDVSHVVLV